MAVKVVVHGAAGRMGRRIVALVSQDPEMELVGALETGAHRDLGKDAGLLAGVGDVGIAVENSAHAVTKECEVVIDFSMPTATLDIARKVADEGKAIVVGTTGFSGQDKRRLLETLTHVPCVMSPNMSIGVNVLFRLAGEATRILGKGFDVEIVETHHRFKADAPSGTALRLGEVIAGARDADLATHAVYGRQGTPGPRTREEIGIFSLRAGDVVGDHTVVFGGMGERIELTHRAHTRDNFAYGALRAAKWVIGKPPGVYDMLDVLALKDPRTDSQ